MNVDWFVVRAIFHFPASRIHLSRAHCSFTRRGVADNAQTEAQIAAFYQTETHHKPVLTFQKHMKGLNSSTIFLVSNNSLSSEISNINILEWCSNKLGTITATSISTITSRNSTHCFDNRLHRLIKVFHFWHQFWWHRLQITNQLFRTTMRNCRYSKAYLLQFECVFITMIENTGLNWLYISSLAESLDIGLTRNDSNYCKPTVELQVNLQSVMTNVVKQTLSHINKHTTSRLPNSSTIYTAKFHRSGQPFNSSHHYALTCWFYYSM